MPLAKGSSDEVVKKNVRELVAAGHDQAQAVAISMRMAGRSRASRGVHARKPVKKGTRPQPY